jgi:nitrogen fixation protein NifU and related proteins
MSDLLYRKDLLRLAADAHGAGRLPEPRLTGEAHNPVCGDRVTADIRLEAGRIEALRLETKACVLTQASASILGRDLKDVTRGDLEKLRAALVTMLETNGPAPPAPFGAFSAFDGATDYPARHRCVLLPLEAVLAAFDKAPRRGKAGEKDRF